MTETVGKVYAEALFLLAQEEQKEEEVYQELGMAADLMAQNPEFVLLMDVPTLDAKERVEILRRVIGDGTGITENFLCLLTEKHRFGQIARIREEYDRLYHEHFGMTEVFVTSAAPLDDKQRAALCEKLGNKLGKRILLRETVDPSLLGGMIVQYGDTRMDNSLRTKLRNFSQQETRN